MSNSPALEPTHRIADMETTGDFEKKHTPSVSATKSMSSGYDLEITTGKEVVHPREPEHWINWIEVRNGESTLARFDFTHLAAPQVTCHLDLEPGTKLDIISSCNMHGLWGEAISL